MAVYSMGTILKKCREMKGITQEELCYGICTASGLSKMEHGLREPSYVKFASLMERMGEWPEAYDVFIGDKVYRIHELEREIQKCTYHQSYDEAKVYLEEYRKEIELVPNETIYFQFYRMMEIICDDRGFIKACRADELEDIIRMTVKEYGRKPL